VPLTQLVACLALVLSAAWILIPLVATDILSPRPRIRFVLAQAQIKSFLEAADRFKSDTGTFPENLGELILDHGSRGLARAIPTRSIPNDPWGQPYLYRHDPSRAEPEIRLCASPRLFDDAIKPDGGSWFLASWTASIFILMGSVFFLRRLSNRIRHPDS
jgi:non-ribosomal peptide synthetase component F